MTTSFLMSIYINDVLRDVESAINSCLNQSVKPDSIYLVLDGPVKEDIKDYLSLLPSFCHVIPLANNVGLGAALNCGLTHVREDLVFRMDSDDISRLDRIEKSIDYFRRNPKCDILGGVISEFKEDLGDSARLRVVPITSPTILKQMRFSSPLNHVSVCFRRASLPIAPYTEKYIRLEDYSTWYKLYKLGLSFANISDVLVDVKLGENFLSKRKGWVTFHSFRNLYANMMEDGFISPFQFVVFTVIRFVQYCVLPKFLLHRLYSWSRKN